MIHKTKYLPSLTLLSLATFAALIGSPESAVAQDSPTVATTGEEKIMTPKDGIEDIQDPYLWLEEIDGERAMAWVLDQNRQTAERLEKLPEFPQLLKQAKAALDNTSRIPDFTQRGEYLYELWRDDTNPRGIYRRMRVSDLRAESAAWDTVLDIDALSRDEGVQWVFKSMSCLAPEYRHCLISLSPGGGDAVEIREFDLDTKAFVDGFFLPAAKSRVDWIDRDTLFVGTDFGPGSMTDSGYPRVAKIWKRGTPITAAKTLFEGQMKSVTVSASHHEGETRDGVVQVPDIDLLSESTTFWTDAYYQIVDDAALPLALPDTANVVDVWRGRLLIRLYDDWTVKERTFTRGSLLIADPEALRGGPGVIEPIFVPSDGIVIEQIAATKQGILISLLDQVKGRLRRYEPKEGGGFTAREIPFPDHGAIVVTTVDKVTGDAFVLYESFVVPPTLFHINGPSGVATEVRAQAPTFDGSTMQVDQYWATSADGTKVPYFVVGKKGLPRNGKNPTHIFSYGGFRNSLVPSYSGSYEKLYGAYGPMWLDRGGVFVLANIRGGGEFGPDWHQAALRENRTRSFEDFEAVAADLAQRKITSAKHIGIEGRSNGGLLVAATYVRHPELYGAVICGVPLADMKRYHQLLAGASWMAEYGDPDVPEDWAFMKEYSPYQNLEAKRNYPAVFFYTSTRDDRVHPGHARKLAAKMIDLGYEVWYYENTEGGHGGSTTNDQLAYRLALAYTHLWHQLQ
ncbi:MAG: prolyl oligopeptidase family serine peptidase [Thermoanaerobaculia bacterium]|nr:prolyl oligopeptidase family serine peptidase [Thermoanaerobaculia bacterium]